MASIQSKVPLPTMLLRLSPFLHLHALHVRYVGSNMYRAEVDRGCTCDVTAEVKSCSEGPNQRWKLGAPRLVIVPGLVNFPAGGKLGREYGRLLSGRNKIQGQWTKKGTSARVRARRFTWSRASPCQVWQRISDWGPVVACPLSVSRSSS
jgi:hypothetical protein